MKDLIGQTINHYHITDRLGEGGMAIVYKAFDTRLERDVALKIIRTDVERDPEKLEHMRQRFTREAQKTAQLLHPNIIPVTDYGTHDGLPYLVMPYLPGGTLKELLDRQGGPMDTRKAAGLLLPVARALAYAHEVGVVHRDIKPSNILVTHSGEPMVTDFGVARILDVEQHTLETLTAPGSTVGTPEYMAPEQWRGDKMDGRVDVWALGVVFYEMVTGRRPFEADTVQAVMVKALTDPLPRPRELVKGLPEAVERVLFTALSRDLKGRYADMGAFATALEKLILGKAGRPRWLVPSVVGGVVVIALGLGLSGVFWPRTAKPVESPLPSGMDSAAINTSQAMVVTNTPVSVGSAVPSATSITSTPESSIAATRTVILTELPTEVPTPPLESTIPLADYLINPQVVFVDPGRSTQSWNKTTTCSLCGVLEGEDIIRIESISPEGAALNSEYKFESYEGALVLTKFESVSKFVVGFYSGQWDSESLRKWGVYQPGRMDIVQGGESLGGGSKVTGNTYLGKPDTWQYILAAMMPNGEFLFVVWDKDDFSKTAYYRAYQGKEFADRGWIFQLFRGSGVILVDTYAIVNFDSFK